MSQTEPPIELSKLEVALRMMIINVRADAVAGKNLPKAAYADPIVAQVNAHQDQELLKTLRHCRDLVEDNIKLKKSIDQAVNAALAKHVLAGMPELTPRQQEYITKVLANNTEGEADDK